MRLTWTCSSCLWPYAPHQTCPVRPEINADSWLVVLAIEMEIAIWYIHINSNSLKCDMRVHRPWRTQMWPYTTNLDYLLVFGDVLTEGILEAVYVMRHLGLLRGVHQRRRHGLSIFQILWKYTEWLYFLTLRYSQTILLKYRVFMWKLRLFHFLS